MWRIQLDSNIIKTYSIDLVFNFIVKHQICADYTFSHNYIELSKAEFLKKFLIVTDDYDKYLVLENCLISKESKILWQKIIKRSKKSLKSA